MTNYERMFGGLPHKAKTPLVVDDTPELDTTDLLGEDGIKNDKVPERE